MIQDKWILEVQEQYIQALFEHRFRVHLSHRVPPFQIKRRLVICRQHFRLS